MPSLDTILRSFHGAAELMRGRPEGLRRLDLSADGFWESFAALPVAVPALALSWIEFREVEGPSLGLPGADPLLAYGAHALADALSWLLPVAVLVLFARRLGLQRRIGPLVVAVNWGGALLAWGFAPYWLLVLLAGSGPGMDALGLLLSIASIVLTIRLVSAAVGRDLPAASFGVVALMVLASLLSYGAVMDVTGVRLL